MVDLASDTFKLQLTLLIIHKEVFRIVGLLNSGEGLSYFWGFLCVHGASSGRDSAIVIWDFSIRRYKGAGPTNIQFAGNPTVDNSRFLGLRNSRHFLSSRICWVPMVLTWLGCPTFDGARETNVWWNEEVAARRSLIQDCWNERAFWWKHWDPWQTGTSDTSRTTSLSCGVPSLERHWE
jgi:hypothetical protein